MSIVRFYWFCSNTGRGFLCIKSPSAEKIPTGVIILMKKKSLSMAVCGICAGAVNGLFGAGGGMLLVPLLTLWTALPDDEVFPSSVSIILPICLVSLSLTLQPGAVPWDIAIPYLLGSAGGGVLAGLIANKIPTLWLHRLLGILILWGGIQYLC